jgi:hypothetical protein
MATETNHSQPNKMRDIASGYVSSQSNWVAFLQCWRAAIDERLKRGDSYSELKGMPPALNIVAQEFDAALLQSKIAEVEGRLKLVLPRSYRDFLVASAGRGWFIEALGELDASGKALNGLSGIGELNWFKDAAIEVYRMWYRNSDPKPVSPKVYYRYGFIEDTLSAQNPVQFSQSDLEGLLLVGELSQGAVILLNARAITSDGEMEAWVLDPGTPGATRYRSFAEMMREIALGDVNNGGPIISRPEAINPFHCGKFLKFTL